MAQTSVSSPRMDRSIRILNIAAVVAMVINILAIFFYAPVEATMGNVQRLFYFHVGSAWVGAIAFLSALIGGGLYLRTSDRKWDNLALASVEAGLVFLSMAIVGGSFWGKPAWNTWWIWSPRLTLVTVAWLVYAAYFMLRGAIEDPYRRARYAAIYAIIAFVTIILTYISIRIFRDIHPVVFGGATEAASGASEGLQEFSNGLDSARMGITLMISTIAFTILGAAWVLMRIRLQNLSDYVDVLKMRTATVLSNRPVAGTAVAAGALFMALQPDGYPDTFNVYLIGGYAVMSAIALIYVVYLNIRERNLSKDLALLTRLLQEDNRAPRQ
ncbi:MAG: cytochrome c biogenesis protein [Chloroflexota bacterium]